MNPARIVARHTAALGRRLVALLGAPIADEWRSGHLHIADLPRSARLLTIGAVAVIAACCIVAILAGAGIGLPGGTVSVPGTLLAEPAPVDVPIVAAVLTCLGLSVAGMTLVAAALRPDQRYPRVTLMGVGVLGASLAAGTLGAVGLLDSFAELAGATDPALSVVSRAAGVGALATAVILAILPVSWARHHAITTILLAAAPFALPLATVMVAALGAEVPVTPVAQALYPAFPTELSNAAAIVGPIRAYTTAVAFVLLPLGLWQAVTWARASARQVGQRLGRHADRTRWLIVALVTAKLTWLALGYAGWLPALLGGLSEVWAEARADGPVAWVYGAALVGIAGVALLQWRRGAISERRAERTAGLTVLLFWSVQALVVVLLIALPILQLVWPHDLAVVPDGAAIGACFTEWLPRGGPALVSCLQTWLLERAPFVQAAVLIGALVVGALWTVRRRRTSAAVFLVVLGAWTLPRSLTILAELPPPELRALSVLPSIDAPGLPTMDTLISLGIAVLALAWLTGRQRLTPPSVLTLALVVSTLLAHGSTLLPSGAGLVFFAVALMFPVVYELTLDSESLNQGRRDRASEVLRAVGLRAGVLTLVAVAISVDVSELTGSANDLFGRLLFALPFSVIVVGVAAGLGHSGGAGGEGAPGEGLLSATVPRSRAARAAVPAAAGLGGIVAVVLAGALGNALEPTVRAAYPLPTDRLAEFESESGRVGTEVALLSSGRPSTDLGAELVTLYGSATGWLSTRRPSDCFAPAWSAYEAFVRDLRELGLLIRAADLPLESATADELQQIGERLPLVGERLQADAGAFDAAIADARSACSGP